VPESIFRVNNAEDAFAMQLGSIVSKGKNGEMFQFDSHQSLMA